MKLPGIAVAALAITALVGGTAVAQVTMQPVPNPPGHERAMGTHHHHHWHHHHWHHHRHHHHWRRHGGRHHHMKAAAPMAAPAPAPAPAAPQ